MHLQDVIEGHQDTNNYTHFEASKLDTMNGVNVHRIEAGEYKNTRNFFASLRREKASVSSSSESSSPKSSKSSGSGSPKSKSILDDFDILIAKTV